MKAFTNILRLAASGGRIEGNHAGRLAETPDLKALCVASSARRDAVFGPVQTYSRKVFIPLTRLCRDVCHYCTFAAPPKRGVSAYLSPDEILAVARAGEAAGCREALFTLGDKPELRYAAARDGLRAFGHVTTLSYLAEAASLVLRETSLLPHLNSGIMSSADFVALRPVAVSMGLMLESGSIRLLEKGGPHFGSPDKDPTARIETLRLAGMAAVPMTTGLLIGIGETRADRITDLLAIRALHEEHGHIQEVIIQNFRAKRDTRMANAPEPALEEHLWTIAVARLILPPDVSVQAPPNLRPGALSSLIAAGVDDWGGISPVTPDYINPEAPWPHLDQLAKETAAGSRLLTERLAIGPAFARDAERWLDAGLVTRIRRLVDATGLPRADEWLPGISGEIPVYPELPAIPPRDETRRILRHARDGMALSEVDMVHLFNARGGDEAAVIAAADALRREVSGADVSYVVTRNVNYTNICAYHCGFCAFSKGRTDENLRGKPYLLDTVEISRRAAEAWARGATEICLQGGIHPAYTGQTYLDILRAVRLAAPGLHIHAFSPLEIYQGAMTLGLGVGTFLAELKMAGLASLPGTAAEILDAPVRAIICPDKVSVEEWLDVMRTAHGLGLRTTATIMFGHVDGPANWVRHLHHIRDLQTETGGFMEFVPLPFVAQEAPLYRKGRTRSGPTYRESVLMHAVARLVLHPLITNIQTSWVKMGVAGAQACLNAGANDLGGTLMNESITRAAGATHGQEMPPQRMQTLIQAIGRIPRPRTTLYGDASAKRVATSFAAAPLE